jgi:cyclin E
VCEVYRLHRETFYLAVDFLDRYLGISSNVPKNRLQLIGVTCLFIGAKLEEIYPPKLQEFAYVTGKNHFQIFFLFTKKLGKNV